MANKINKINVGGIAYDIEATNVSDAVITITQNGITKGTFSLNGQAATIALSDNNTTYNAATTSANGLMTAADKAKLDGIQSGADAVSVTRNVTTGTKVCTININGTNYDIYAPEVTSIDDGELV